MNRYITLISLYAGLLCSCSEPPKKTNNTTSTPACCDTTAVATLNPEKYFSLERGRSTSNDYSALIKSNYLLPDVLEHDSSYYCQGNFLFFIDKTTKILDSIELAEGCENGVIIQDVTNQLHFNNPVFMVASPGGSDYYTCEFIQYGDTLKKLFEIAEFGRPITLQWKDEHTLTGFTAGRDELVNDFQDYPVIVSLDNYQVTIERPVKQRIHYTTQALENFKGYRLSASNDKTDFSIRKGTTILIDSLNRSNNTVRVIVNDSIVVYVPFRNIKDKIQTNAAG